MRKSILATFLTQFPVIVISLITGILITRIVGAEGKGVYALLQTNTQLFVLVFGLNIGMGLTYFLSKKEYSTESIIGLGILGTLIGGGAFLLFIASLYFFSPNNIFLPDGFNSGFYYVYLLVAFISNALQSVIGSVFIGLKKFSLINKLNIFSTGINAFVFAIVYFYVEKNMSSNLEIVLFISILLLLMNLGVKIFLFSKVIKIKPSFKFGNGLSKIFKTFVLTGFFANLLNMLNYRLDIWIIEYYLDLKQLGYYALAVNITQMLWMVTNPIVSIVQPHLNSPDEKNKLNKFIFYSKLNLLIVLTFGFVIFVTADVIVPMVYGREFIHSTGVIKILLIGVVFGAITKMFAVAIVNSQKIKYNLLATLFGLFATVVLDLLLIPVYGIVGAGIATSIAYFVIFVAVYYFLCKKIGYPFRNYFVFKSYGEIMEIKKLE